MPAILPAGSYTMEKSDPDTNAFCKGLAIIMGVGFLKPNISTIVGQLYPQGDPRRDSGFTLYYYGINLGAFWASVLCGLLGQTVGWWAGFGLAGVGMALGWVVFVLGKPLLQGKGEPPNPARLKEAVAGPINREWLIYILAILGVGGVWVLVQRNTCGGLGPDPLDPGGAGFHRLVHRQEVRQGRTRADDARHGADLRRGGVLHPVRAGRHLAQPVRVAQRRPRHHIAGHELPGPPHGSADQCSPPRASSPPTGVMDRHGHRAAQTQSFNAGFILIFAPIFAVMWTYFGKRGKVLDPTFTFGLGLIQVGLGFLVVVWRRAPGWSTRPIVTYR